VSAFSNVSFQPLMRIMSLTSLLCQNKKARAAVWHPAAQQSAKETATRAMFEYLLGANQAT
jgi:hypothetical protein